jgi:hypothetical protein
MLLTLSKILRFPKEFSTASKKIPRGYSEISTLTVENF